MSELGTPAEYPHEPTTTPEAPAPSRRGSLAILALALVLILAGGGYAGYVLLHHTKAAATAPAYPKHWDPRILPYVKIVEKERGHQFKHPVAVRFLSPAAFEKTVRTTSSKLTAKDHKQIDQETGIFRALGLLPGGVDLFKAMNSAYGSSTLAYYSFDDQRVTVRGTTITPSGRSTLVHELTHALQDQLFNIGARTKALDKASADGAPDTGESSVLGAIVEGDATRVETLYAATLSRADQRALAASQAAEGKQASSEAKGVPKVVLTMIASPYAFGEALVTAVAQQGGTTAIDDLLKDPPTHEAALIDPFRVLTGDTGAVPVDAPKLAAGEKRFGSGEFGDLTLYFALAQRLPLREALAAADGWGGDAYVGFDRQGMSCVRINYVGNTATDTARIGRDLQTWAAAAPASPVKITRDGDAVQFESCDPGTKATVGKDFSDQALQLATVRTYIGIDIMKSGAPAPFARCVAAGAANVFTPAQLMGPGSPAITARVRKIALGCR